MAITDDLGIGGFALPAMPDVGGSLLTTFLIIVILATIGIFAFVYLDHRKYKYKIEVYENLGGKRYTRTIKDTAKIVKVGDGGEQILWLKRSKCYRTAYGRKMDNNTFWFAIGQDGYWYNITLGDLDAKQGELDIEPIDRDMRYMHVAIRKNIQDRYKKQNAFEKYGTIIMNAIFLIIMLFGMWFLIDKFGDVASANQTAAAASEKAMQLAQQVLGNADKVCASSGIQ